MVCQSIKSITRLTLPFFPVLAKLSPPVRSRSLLCFLDDLSWALVAVMACLTKFRVFKRLGMVLLLGWLFRMLSYRLVCSFGLRFPLRTALSWSMPVVSRCSRRKIFCLHISFCFLNYCIYCRIETTLDARARLPGLV